MRILVTGGSGFIGTNLISHFLACGDEVLSVDVVPPRNPQHRRCWRELDVRHGDALSGVVGSFLPDAILHMAARTDLDAKSIEDYSANTEGVRNLVAAIEGVSTVRRVIFASSRLVCRIGYQPKDEFDVCPTTAYGQSKVLGEQIVREAGGRLGCTWLLVRPTSIWGPWFGVPYKTFFLTIARGRYFHPGSQRILKSFGFVGNTVHELQALLAASDSAVHGRTLYLADYPPTDVARMANTIQQAVGVAPIRTVSADLLRPAAWIGDMLKVLGWRDPPLTSFRLNNLLTPMVHELGPLENLVGELPYGMEEGVRITVDWMREWGEIN